MLAFLGFKKFNLQLAYCWCVNKSQLLEAFGRGNVHHQLSPLFRACIEHTHFGAKRFMGGVAERSTPMRVLTTSLSRPRERMASPIQRSTAPLA